MPEVTIAIGAIPNTGKTTLFNRLTGARQTTGNWAGVTVEKKQGRFQLDEYDVALVDLPGAYSLSPNTVEERIVREYLMGTAPDLLINVVDAGNLYRGLGLTLQLATIGLPMVLAVNMMDEARRRGLQLDIEALSEHLGIPVVPLVARTGEGVTELKLAVLETLKGTRLPHPPRISVPPVLEDAIADLVRQIEARHANGGLDASFLAIRLLEGGHAADSVVAREPELAALLERATCSREQIERSLGEDLVSACARCRFDSARGLVREVAHQAVAPPTPLTKHLDNLVLHPLLGLPLFLTVMWLMFQGVFTLGAPLQNLLGGWMTTAQDLLRHGATVLGVPELIINFSVDGVVAGVGVVLSFFPIIALFFIFLSLIEDTGYMARAAFLMDRVMHMLRLDGKAFVSILLGYGCNVPAVMGTRILSSQHSRILTMLLVPFSLCSARLQVFLFLSSILFVPMMAGWVVFALYVGSFVAIILTGLALRPLRIGGPPEPFIMELPPYRLPAARTVALRAWQEVKEFLRRAATLIIFGVVVVWFLTHFPADVPVGGPETLAGRLGTMLSFMFDPVGIHWHETVALIFGFIAKEIVVGAMAVIYGASASDLPAQIAAQMSPLRGISFMVFTLLYTPCIATVAAIKAEARSWKVAAAAVLLGLVMAWLAAFATYRIGLALGYS
jgi:ferrous iron transport protein B